MRHEGRVCKSKRCHRCGITKSARYFSKNRTSRDGLQTYCKTCTKAGAGVKIDHRIGCDCKACVTRANAVIGLKWCGKCCATKAFGDFYSNRLGTNGLDSWCKTCSHAGTVVSLRKTKYHLDADQYQELLEKQNYRCASCGDEFGGAGPMVDHDHKCCPREKTCGRCVRGLVCSYCNTALGMIKDDPNKALALAAYLMRFEDVLAQGHSPWA